LNSKAAGDGEAEDRSWRRKMFAVDEGVLARSAVAAENEQD